MRTSSYFADAARTVVLLAATSSACKSSPPAAAPTEPVASGEPAADVSSIDADASRGLADPALVALFRDHWNESLRRSPVWATSRGDHRYDSQLRDLSDAAAATNLAADGVFLERARAIDPARLTALESTSLALLAESLESALATSVCAGHLWEVSPFSNPVADLSVVPELHKIRSEADAESLLARYQTIPAYTDAAIANLKLGAERGLFANAVSVTRAIEQIDSVLAQPIEKWALMGPAKDARALSVLSEAVKTRWLQALWEVTSGPVKQAFTRYRDFLESEVLPRARGPEVAGVGSLSIGPACYAARIRRYLGKDRPPDELHALGHAEIARINHEMRTLGKKLFDTDDLGAITTRLRTDTALYFKSAGEITAAARDALETARARTPEFFGIQPKADCVVTPIPAYEAPFSTIAYYREPHADGSVPGQFFINTYKPSIRPRFEMRVLAYHEAIPGHHLQIAIAHERTNLPAFRRSEGSTAFVEGWALYTERLAEEMGLYKTDLDRMGMLSYDAWRAARLVVDTGIHTKGWTREKAEEYMREHTALTGANIVNEVDRYINWPGQALAYKVGQLAILGLRAEATAALGDRFDIKAFHDVVLRDGAVSLPVLEQNVRAWIDRAQQAK